MWRYIFFYISICLFVSETLTLNVEKSSHDRNLRHVNEGKKCEDGDKNEGVCKDDRDIDFDDYGFEKGCYHPDKPCWLFNYCEGHMHCYIIFEKEDGTRLDEACLSIGGHCVKPGTRFDGILRKNLCPCDYDCYLQVADELCVSPNHCQHIDAPCGGTKNSALCDGEDFVCCVSHTNDGKCTNEPPTGVKGTCKDNTEECDGWYVTDRCSGPAGRQCCVPSGNDVDCTSIPNAQCMDIRKEPCENEEGEEGDYRSGLCSGPAYRQCCILGCPDHYKGLNNEDISTDCHLNYGCCRPFCIDGEIQIDFSCQTKDRDGNLITSNCVCCKGDRPVSAKPGGGGDPHYKTLDSHTYTFDGHCSYILMRECSNYLGTPRFTVIAKHDLMESLRRKLKAYIDSISIIMGTFRADLLHGNLVSINNRPAIHIHDLREWNDTDKGIYITPDQGMTKVDVAGEFTVWFNGNGRCEVAIDTQYHGKLCGLLGNANDDPYDDLQKLTSDGLKLVTDVNEFANSWAVPKSCP